MFRQPRLIEIRRVLIFIFWSLFCAGCAMLGLGGDQSQRPRGNESAFKESEEDRTFDIRAIRAGAGGRAVLKETQAGKMPDGYLVTLTWTDDIELVRILCLNPEAAGCQRSEQVPAIGSSPSYRRQVIILYVKEQLSDLTAKILTHEICHTVANSQNLLPDPCHNENGGPISIPANSPK